MSVESFCPSTVGRVQTTEIKSKIANSPMKAGRIKTVFCHISQKTLLNLDLCLLLFPNKVVSSKGRLSSKHSKLIHWSESCGLFLHHQSPKKGFTTVLSGIWTNCICTVTRGETSHKSVCIVRQIQWKVLFPSFSSKHSGFFKVSWVLLLLNTKRNMHLLELPVPLLRRNH